MHCKSAMSKSNSIEEPKKKDIRYFLYNSERDEEPFINYQLSGDSVLARSRAKTTGHTQCTQTNNSHKVGGRFRDGKCHLGWRI